ncbi:MAG: tRNA/rRNA methyltransferase [Parcubacteria group bacterium GW2011_GWF2_38_76]|nr:MAG: tRNA/rRNA methyltransferase [Parcubacteria group bacterium GW2011_GWF2_38_76]HBM46178.1 RNA methyltransferase [Patescibacteria group bacterium]
MKAKNKTKELYLILDDIRSNFNVGSIFRIADCAGVRKIFLGGITPTPVDRFGRDNSELKKVSLGAEDTVFWEKVSSVSRLINKLKKDGFEIVSLEQSNNSIDYKKFKLKQNTALILGNEVAGVKKNILKSSDKIIEIKMKGKKESLNVAVATGITVFRLLNV